MNFPITIEVYPLMGGWRAECTKCGAYGNCQFGKTRKSMIAEALDNLAANQNFFREESKGCAHFYGNYKPRVSCYMDFNSLSKLGCPYTPEGCENFPAITVDYKYRISLRNAKVDYNWSAYSFVNRREQ